MKSPTNGIRLYQEGAQKIIGFDFSASLTMDMTGVQDRPNSAMPRKAIQFKLVRRSSHPRTLAPLQPPGIALPAAF